MEMSLIELNNEENVHQLVDIGQPRTLLREFFFYIALLHE